MMKRSILGLALGVAFVAMTGAVQAGVTELQASKYFTVTDEGINGTPDWLCLPGSCANGHLGFVSNAGNPLGGTTWVDITFAEFDVSGVPSTPAQVMLDFHTYQPGNGSFARPIYIWSYIGDGIAAESDYTAARTFLGTVFTPSSLGLAALALDLTAAVDWAHFSSPYLGIAFSTGGANSQAFICPNSDCSSGGPVLSVTTRDGTVPEPETLALLLFGVAAFAMTRRRT
jgi:hypothetical protein